MKRKPIILGIISLAIALPATADTFTLKDGSTVEGTVLSEAGDSYLVEVQVTKSIKDERTIAKADVAKVVRERKDQTAFEAIAKLVPTPDLLTDEEYGQRISAANKFIKDFSDSTKKADVEKILATLKQESAQIASGGVKMNGTIITPEEYKLNAYELDAKVQEARIRNMVQAGQYLGALRAYSEYAVKFKGTTSLAVLTPVMRQVAKRQVAEAKQLLATYPERLKKRQVGLERMSPDDRRITENAIKDEDAAIEARLKVEKDAKITWVTFSPFNKSSLDEIVRAGESESRLMDSVTIPAPGQDSGKLWRDAMALIRNGSPAAEVTAAITATRSAGVPPDYITILEDAAKANLGK